MYVRKFPASACKDMLKYFERYTSQNGTIISFSDEVIDTNKTYLNYNLAPDRGNQYEFMKKRCREANAVKRTDLITMCTIEVIKPKDLPESITEEAFFKAVYNHFRKKLGEENIISCYVHKDENSQPHCHVAFVPACPDKNGKITVSARRLISRPFLRLLHAEAEVAVSEELGQKIHLINGEATIDRSNLSASKYKEYIEIQEQLEAKKKEIAELQKEIHAAQEILKKLKKN